MLLVESFLKELPEFEQPRKMPVEPKIEIIRIVRKYFLRIFLIQSVSKFYFLLPQVGLNGSIFSRRKK